MRYEDPNQWRQPVPKPEPGRGPTLVDVVIGVVLGLGFVVALELLKFIYA